MTPDPWSSYEFKEVGTEGCIYHVEFLGKTRTHSWLPEEMVRDLMYNHLYYIYNHNYTYTFHHESVVTM